MPGADIFVSIHHNAMPMNATVTGIETYYYEYDSDYPPIINEDMHNDPTRILESADLASAIQGSLVENTGAIDRGVRRNTFACSTRNGNSGCIAGIGIHERARQPN